MSIRNSQLYKLRHTLAHILAAAVKELYGEKVKFGTGPVVKNGFYYDLAIPGKITQQDLPKIESQMKKIIKKNLPLRAETWGKEKALQFFEKNNQPFKIELIKKHTKNRERIFVYHLGDIFTDLCEGPHLKNTSQIDPASFKLTKIGAVFWQAKEDNPQLTRISGLAFKTKKELSQFLELQEQAAQRDHRKLGKQLDLFLFSQIIGAGLPLWTPRGALLRELLDNFVWSLRKKRGYQKVEIPHITKKELFKISGHWDKFADQLFKIKSREGDEFALKPMNCPFHAQIYSSRRRSYRELPQRYANTTMVYRDEQSGELLGLTRVRSITQDDAHVFCSPDQIRQEIFAIWDIVDKFYSTFGFDLQVHLSLSNPQKPQDYLGDPKLWQKAEKLLRSLTQERKTKVKTQTGEAAFYGPKVDFIAQDSLKRHWQVATIQLDFNMPANFNLNFINQHGKQKPVVMIHAAIMGAIERFIAILLEHFSGALPAWLHPIQLAILPVAEAQNDYAKKIKQKLLENQPHLRLELKGPQESLGKRIRKAQLQKIPYQLIIGPKEQKNKTLALRLRTGKEIGEITLDQLISQVREVINDKKLELWN